MGTKKPTAGGVRRAQARNNPLDGIVWILGRGCRDRKRTVFRVVVQFEKVIREEAEVENRWVGSVSALRTLAGELPFISFGWSAVHHFKNELTD